MSSCVLLANGEMESLFEWGRCWDSITPPPDKTLSLSLKSNSKFKFYLKIEISFISIIQFNTATKIDRRLNFVLWPNFVVPKSFFFFFLGLGLNHRLEQFFDLASFRCSLDHKKHVSNTN